MTVWKMYLLSDMAILGINMLVFGGVHHLEKKQHAHAVKRETSALLPTPPHGNFRKGNL